MLSVRSLSGNVVTTVEGATLGRSDFLDALKHHLSDLMGLPTQRLRLCCGGQEVLKSCSWSCLGFPAEMQVLVLPYDMDATQDLVSAISEEDYEGVLSALRMPADPNAQYCLSGCNRKILMPLVVACAVSNLSIVRALVQASADV
ncbi:HERC2, partial [Symbiodinium necroappetens]